jgi:hypothetical protein
VTAQVDGGLYVCEAHTGSYGLLPGEKVLSSAQKAAKMKVILYQRKLKAGQRKCESNGILGGNLRLEAVCWAESGQ